MLSFKFQNFFIHNQNLKIMKRTLTFMLFSFVLLQVKAQDNALRSLCFTDGFGYTYTFPSVQVSGSSFSATGTANAYASTTCNLSGHFTSSTSGTMTMDVINNNPDGCTSFTDSYTYTGTWAKSGSSFTGSGSWVSYCNGSALGSGTWTASGPCVGPVSHQSPVGPAAAKKNGISNIRVQPNPAVSMAQIYYTVASTQKVNITIYNSMQQPVATLINETKTAGNYSVNWNLLSTNGVQVTNGIYTAVIRVGNDVYTKPVQVIK